MWISSPKCGQVLHNRYIKKGILTALKQCLWVNTLKLLHKGDIDQAQKGI